MAPVNVEIYKCTLDVNLNEIVRLFNLYSGTTKASIGATILVEPIESCGSLFVDIDHGENEILLEVMYSALKDNYPYELLKRIFKELNIKRVDNLPIEYKSYANEEWQGLEWFKANTKKR